MIDKKYVDELCLKTGDSLTLMPSNGRDPIEVFYSRHDEDFIVFSDPSLTQVYGGCIVVAYQYSEIKELCTRSKITLH